jgi:predicted nucleotidyltransferase
MDYSKKNILNIISENSIKIQNFGIKRLALFGSYARNEQSQSSDLDFIADFYKGKKTYRNFIRLCYFLEELFGKRVDLLTFDSLPQDRNFTENVKNDLILLIDNK